MILTNWLAKLVVKTAAKITPNTVGVTLWPFIFIYPPELKNNERLIKHEQEHIKQYKKYWIAGFLPVYIYNHIKYGYQNNPLETEARNAEGK